MRRILFVLLCLCAPVLHAQDTTAIKSYVRNDSIDVADTIGRDRSRPGYVVRAQDRIIARGDSILRAMRVGIVARVDTVRITIHDTVVVTRIDTVYVQKDTTTTPPTPPDTTKPDTTVTKPDTTTPPQSGFATLPQNMPSAKYPSCTTTVRVLAGTDLQAAINSATPGVCLLLAPGATWIGNFTLPNKAGSSFVTATTDGYVSVPGRRVTSTIASNARFAKVLTPNSNSAFTTAPGAHHYILRGLEIGTAPTMSATETYALVSLNATTTPSDIQLQEDYIHGASSYAVRRCVLANSANTVVVDSWLADCHSNNSDSQAILGYNCTRGLLIQNNTLMAGHEVVMFGGADPVSASCIPQDVILRGNHVYRPTLWYKVWQVKNSLETKDVQRYLIEGNIIENSWLDAQVGFAIVFKSENQGGAAPFTISKDITMRYNRIRSVTSGWNISGHGSNSFTSGPSARIDVHDNLLEDVKPTAWGGQGIVAQFLTGLTSTRFTRNTLLNSASTASAMFFDGPATSGLVVDGNVFHHGTYGVGGTGTGEGLATFAKYAPDIKFTNNAIVGATSTACGKYPATTTCPATFPSLPTATVGADTATIMRLTKNAMVLTPIVNPVPSARRAIQARQAVPWKPTDARCLVTQPPAGCELPINP